MGKNSVLESVDSSLIGLCATAAADHTVLTLVSYLVFKNCAKDEIEQLKTAIKKDMPTLADNLTQDDNIKQLLTEHMYNVVDKIINTISHTKK